MKQVEDDMFEYDEDSGCVHSQLPSQELKPKFSDDDLDTSST